MLASVSSSLCAAPHPTLVVPHAKKTKTAAATLASVLGRPRSGASSGANGRLQDRENVLGVGVSRPKQVGAGR
jgi:hypothetical protein